MKVCTTCGAEWPDDTKFCPSDGSALKLAGGGEDLVGGVLQSYHIIKKLGEGGMGAVYLGEHVKMGRKSAIKVMTQSLAQDTDAIARFNREAANAASINHVNVCAIYDFGETHDGTIFLAMEYIEGEALTDLIKREGPLDLKRAGTILQQTGDALQAAHELGIVHRDLKPDNIMIAKGRDGSDLVKVVDFGIAKAMSGDEEQNVTRTGLVVGTPEYMSPEQLSGDKLDGRSDVYSLALVFFRMVTGALPYQADSAQEVMIKRLTDEPARLNDALPGGNFPPKLQLVVDRAMERMPSDRYPTAEEFVRDAMEAIAAAPAREAAPLIDTQGATQLLGTGPADLVLTEQLKKTRLSEPQATVPMGRADAPDAAAGKDVAAIATEIIGDRAAATAEPPLPQEKEEPRKRPSLLTIAGGVMVVGIVSSVGYVMLTGGGDRPELTIDSTLVDRVLQNADGGGGTQPGTDREGAEAGDGSRNAQQQHATDNSAPTGGENPNGTPTTNADSINIDLQLEGLIDRILETETVLQARTDAQAVYTNPAANPTQRSQAAYQLALSYDPMMALEGSSLAMACTWISRALEFAPTNGQYLEFQQGKCSL